MPSATTISIDQMSNIINLYKFYRPTSEAKRQK